MPRQQRRKNAQTAYSQFPAYPQVFFNYTVTATGPATITITNPWGIMAPSIPQLQRNALDFPVSMNQPNDLQLELTYATPFGVDDVIQVPNWCQNLRGFNGEYFAPRQWRVNSNECTTGVIYVFDTIVTLSPVSAVTFSEDVTLLSTPPWTLDDGNTVVSAAPGPGSNQIELTWNLPISAYTNFLQIPEGDSSVKGVTGRFVAPARAFML